MKILLILPASDDFRVASPTALTPPRKMLRFSLLPLTTVAALTPPGHEIKIVDENVEYLDLDTPADLVGITFMTALAPRAYEIARAFRNRGIPVVAGGYHPTFMPDEAAKHFDAVVVGEAELHWAKVVEDVQLGKLSKIYQCDHACDPSMIPIPRRELTSSKSDQYVTVNAVQTGRGCRNKCRYCSITAFHKGQHRSRPIETVLEELRQIPRTMLFIDDNLIADRPYIVELLTRMIPLKKRWVTQCSIDLADDPELLRLMKAAGCIGIFFGVESINQRNLDQFDKSFNNAERFRERVRKIHKAGITVFTSIIVGGEHDDATVFPEMFDFLQTIHSDGLQLNIMTPLPGTPLFDTMKREGRVIDFDWSKYDFRHVVIQPRLMSQAELQTGADWIYAQFYRLDRILLRSARVFFRSGWAAAWVVFGLNMTYRYDVKQERLWEKVKGVEWRKEAAPEGIGVAVGEVA